jgi:hypothetical protein
MRNMTITLSDAAAEWARIEAARRDTSVSRLVGEMIEQKMKRADEYERARREFMSIKPQVLRAPEDRYPSRDEVYVRGGPAVPEPSGAAE